MTRALGLACGLLAYGMFLAVFLYLIGFVGNLWVPKSIDAGGEVNGLFAVAVNLTLIAFFGLQHSLMAREEFKRWLAEFLPRSVERSVYVMATSLVLAALFVLWQPIPAEIWVAGGGLAILLNAGFWLGWLIVVASTFLTGHTDMIGLRQAWLAYRRRRYRTGPFVTRHLYRFVRHPLYLGMLLAMWSTPRMTVGHLLFAAGMTGYVLIGMRFEERDLALRYGRAYRSYRSHVPALIPRPGHTHSESDPRGRLI